MILSELADKHEITLVALSWNDEDRQALQELAERGLPVHAIPHGVSRRLSAVPALAGKPLQYAVARSSHFATTTREIIRQADAAGKPFDAIHVEHLRGAAAIDLFKPLGVRTVFDAVDCLAELARLSCLHSTSRLVRAVARYEHPRTQRIESQLIRAADIVTVVAERDRTALLQQNQPANVLVVPNGVNALPQPVPIGSQPEVVFTGKLSYHANQAAADWLTTDIWPQIRQLVPAATLTIAGANPPEWLTKRNGHNGVRVMANPPDMQEVLRSARVAIAPVVYSVGIQNKVLEAMAMGIPVVASPSAAAGLLPGSDGTLALAESARDLAMETARLLLDDIAASRLGAAGFDYVSRQHSWSAVARQFEALYMGEHNEAKAA